MSVEQLENQIQQLAPKDRRRLADWFDAHRAELLGDLPESDLTEVQKTELLRRRQEYIDHPERFTRITSNEELEEYFQGINREVHARIPSARKD